MPFPEEMNRRVVDAVGDWLFAPTAESRANLLREHLPGRITVTGNTVIDALAMTCAKLAPGGALAATLAQRYQWLDPTRRLLLVTGHRRESFGDGFKNICAALAELARRDDLQIVYPVHLNPQVRSVVMTDLGNLERVHLIDPLDYLDFVWFMQQSHLILTDSGGVQEEAPYLGKPVLVMRDVTERPEAAGRHRGPGRHRYATHRHGSEPPAGRSGAARVLLPPHQSLRRRPRQPAHRRCALRPPGIRIRPLRPGRQPAGLSPHASPSSARSPHA